MEDNFSMDWEDGFGMMQAHYIYYAFMSIIITSTPSQSVRD